VKTCLITLDFINDICHPEGKLARYADRIAKNRVIEHANQAIALTRENKWPVVHVKVAFRDNYLDGSSVSPLFTKAKANQVLKQSEWGAQFVSTLDYQQDDVVIIKHRVSAFYGTDLDLILRANRIEHIILCGVATNNAVELTAREAHDRDYVVSVLSDASESANDEEQEASLHFLSRIANVRAVESLINATK